MEIGPMFSALLTDLLALNADSTTWNFDDAKAGELPIFALERFLFAPELSQPLCFRQQKRQRPAVGSRPLASESSP
jgi:hypothetical protein